MKLKLIPTFQYLNHDLKTANEVIIILHMNQFSICLTYFSFPSLYHFLISIINSIASHYMMSNDCFTNEKVSSFQIIFLFQVPLFELLACFLRNVCMGSYVFIQSYFDNQNIAVCEL